MTRWTRICRTRSATSPPPGQPTSVFAGPRAMSTNTTQARNTFNLNSSRDVELNDETLGCPGHPGLMTYGNAVVPHAPSADARRLLAAWSAPHREPSRNPIANDASTEARRTPSLGKSERNSGVAGPRNLRHGQKPGIGTSNHVMCYQTWFQAPFLRVITRASMPTRRA
jgi:hypothetical protein